MSDAPTVNSAMTGSELAFHPEFNVKRPDSIILRAQLDDKSFYFSRPLLSALSPFFATIPEATIPRDTYEGVPVLPIDAQSASVNVFLKAIQSISKAEPFGLQWQYGGGEAVIGAALLAGLFDCPIVFRILGEALEQTRHLSPYHTYAIWVIAKVPAKIAEAAVATLRSRIVHVDRSLVKTLRLLAPDEWSRLLDFHLRRIQGMEIFHETRLPDEGDQPHYGSLHDEPCTETVGDLDGRIAALFANASSVEEVEAIRLRRYGLKCYACVAESDEWYYGEQGPVRQLIELASKYYRSE